jgi:hypothetical protein
MNFRPELTRVKPIFSRSEELIKIELGATKPFLKVLNVLINVQEHCVTIFHKGLKDILGLLRDIIDDIVKEEPVERFGVSNWLIPVLLFFFLVDIFLCIIREVALKSSNLQGQLKER